MLGISTVAREKRMALAELSNGHGEVLLPQVEFLLANGVEVWVIVRRSILDSGILEPVRGAIHVHELSGARGLARLREYWRIRRLLRENGIGRLVINTAEGKDALRLCWMSGRRIKKFGILHNPHKLLSSTTQRLISRSIEQYLVIGERLCKERHHFPGAPHLECFYPVLRGEPSETRPSAKELVICIPGNLEQKRRDYFGLLEQLRGHTDLAGRVRFILLGDASRGEGPELKERIERFGLGSIVTTFSGRVPQSVFLDQVEAADALMSLTHPDCRYFEMYREYKVSGALQLALSYKKPLLMHEDLQQPGLEAISIPYRWPAFLADLAGSAAKWKVDCARVAHEYDDVEKFSFRYQAEHYASLVLDF